MCGIGAQIMKIGVCLCANTYFFDIICKNICDSGYEGGTK